MAENKITSTRLQKTPAVTNTPLNTYNNTFPNNSTTANDGTKITTFFFDLDNTLIPTRSGDSKACRKLSEVLENQFAFSKDDSTTATQTFLKAFRRCPDNSQTSLDSWRTYLWREALPARYKHLAEEIFPIWLKLRYRCLAITPDYIQMLKRIREAGYLLALITNGPSNAQWEKIQKLHVSQYFDCVLVSSDLPWEKPNPQIFYAACNFLDVKPSRCAMVGDKLESDIKGGRLSNLGATFWLPINNTEIDLTDVTHPPDIILRNLLDLYKYFPILNVTTNNGSSTNGAAVASAAGTASATAASAITTAAATTNLQLLRRCSQISCNSTTASAITTTSTCNSDLQPRHYQPQFHNYHQYQQQQQTQQLKSTQQQRNNQNCYKYRRGGSLPTMEYLNSETENSSDSIFN